jgi:hypothetical protein
MARIKKQVWTVRVVNYRPTKPLSFDNGIPLPGIWLEQLRYMGFAKELADYDDRNVIEFYAPKGADTKVWADQNAARMRSFGIDAAAAPQWMDDTYDRPMGASSRDSSHMERFNKGRSR